MNAYLVVGILAAVLIGYFSITLVILPDEYRSYKVIEPQPVHFVTISDDYITLGESFMIKVTAKNQNDFADIMLTLVGFPNLDDHDSVEVIGYDFTQSPKEIQVGDDLGSGYTSGEPVQAAYPGIEADSRNIPAGSEFQMTILVTPQKTGPFEVYVKTVAIPHTTELAHFPHEGAVDPQGEFVDVHTVRVNP